MLYATTSRTRIRAKEKELVIAVRKNIRKCDSSWKINDEVKFYGLSKIYTIKKIGAKRSYIELNEVEGLFTRFQLLKADSNSKYLR